MTIENIEETYADVCYECTGYGDDYYEDENGDLVFACDSCWVRERMNEDDD